MITSIFIKNFILIDKLELDLSNGLNIITGETGAGKSILINAIDLAFGARCGKELIGRYGDKVLIELSILNDNHDLKDLFAQYGIDDNGNEIILSKEITQNGSKSKINGCMVNQEFLKLFRECFLDIHSQHQTYSIMQQKNHLKLLDTYIKSNTLKEYKSEYEEYKTLLNNLKNIENSIKTTEEQIEFLKYQVDEITSANILSQNEDEELNNELAILENAEKLKELTGSSYWAISGDNNSILEGLYDVKNSVTKASNLDNTLVSTEGELAEIIDKLKSVSSVLREYSSSMENDTERIDEIQERLFILDKLKHKYGGTIEKVLETGIKLHEELENITCSTQKLEELTKIISQKEEILMNLAKKVSEERHQQAENLAVKIVNILEKLELPKVRFKINLEKQGLYADGIDSAEFLISTNISEEMKPIIKVASGGEISRIMLALKSVFAQADDIDTIIFDEIDTGISGKTSQAVAEEVKKLSKFIQIIMITHQAIIASKADKHFYVKKSQGDITSVSVYNLEGENRLKGIAELISGKINEESINLAKTLI